jgi:hypothetical protein
MKSILFALALACSTWAQAGVVFLPGNNPQIDEENILFNGVGSISGPALTVTGRTTQSDLLVNFLGQENLVTPANGQARVAAEDGAFTFLSISLPGGTFHDFILNINQNRANGFGGVAHVVVDLLGAPDVAYDFDLADTNGQNFLTIRTSLGDRIECISFTSSVVVAFVDFRQNRISGAELTVAEPGTLALVAVAFLGIATSRRRTRN